LFSPKSIGLDLFQFHQNTVAVFGVKKNNWFPMSSLRGLFRQHSDIFALQFLHGGIDIIDLAPTKQTKKRTFSLDET